MARACDTTKVTTLPRPRPNERDARYPQPMSDNPSTSFSSKIGQLIEENPNCALRDSSKDNRHVTHKADHDYENRFELFLLDEGQQKVEEKAETRT